jgi:hypothetical protein
MYTILGFEFTGGTFNRVHEISGFDTMEDAAQKIQSTRTMDGLTYGIFKSKDVARWTNTGRFPCDKGSYQG